MDNFDWTMGFTERQGLYYINFSTPELVRVPKISAKFYKQLIDTRKFNKLSVEKFTNQHKGAIRSDISISDCVVSPNLLCSGFHVIQQAVDL